MPFKFGGDSAAARAAMSQADAENSGLSPKRSLGSFHLRRDHRQRGFGFRMGLEFAHVLICPWGPIASVFLCHYAMLPQDWAGCSPQLLAKVEKPPHLMRLGAGQTRR
jgi:hypothetical protein